ncbi:uncharacterized protein A1O5_00533 [Cladophialophora psammophila CBS 110553]|uniref:Eisosome protein 1 n=1 Tax=Cladophialophora psammophila CBS 110553 TaxID=1182543 RepID=W9XFA3_9EURO|nr:uncharacterized protein A1O5_00533 [Cladophialophora psammophila CBS 110553]EXJ76025.1 hypothetical protein A1O5_00533 [Cladophialophora psammophila CBS 110553]
MSASVAHAHAQAHPNPHPHHSSFAPSHKLEDQAASAALSVVRDTPTTKHSTSSILDEEGRLSAASVSTPPLCALQNLQATPRIQFTILTAAPGAALSLKYARAQDLPSYPSAGGVKLASAGAAASLAESKKRSIELWTPGVIPQANTAAYRAKDYEMEPLWKPELSRAGSQAALAAHRDAAPVDIWTAPETEQGHSAASSALQNPKSPPPITERHVSSDGRQKALLAATASLSGGRRRAESAPTRPAPTPVPSAWAIKAATSSQNVRPPSSPTPPSTSELSGVDAARVQHIAKSNVSRQMYTSNPPVAIEVEERRRQEMLRASAVAMARKMFAIQQVQIDEARGIHRSQSHYAAYTARRRAQSDAANQPATTDAVPRYENLEEAARRLAQERLAKLHDEHAEYRQYYGQQTAPPRSRLTLRRGRRTSDIREDDDSDLEESRKIRAQMSLFQGKLAEVDSKKRQADRDALLAVAHKNVTARMNAMDEKVFSETGKTSPQQRELWERQARERAQRESDERLLHVGKVHIGGGKYLEHSEIEAIAKARLQPTLDEITEKAEQQRAKDEELRLEQERLKAEQEAEKKRQADIKAEQKAVVDREKAEQKAQKAEERRIQQEQKHEERRLRTEQKATEKKARGEASTAERERRRTEREEKRQTEPGKTRFLPSFLGRGAVTAGAAAGAATAAVAEVTADVVGGGARALTAASAVPGTMTAEGGEVAGETVHDQVTLDPNEAAHAVAAADTEDKAQPSEEPREVAQTAEEEAEPKDHVGTTPYSSTTPPQEPTFPTSPTSPTSPSSPSKRDSRVKTWFRRLRAGSKAENDLPEHTAAIETDPKQNIDTGGQTTEPVKDEDDQAATDSIRDVALAGRSDNETDDMYGGSVKPYGRISPIHDGPVIGENTGPGPTVTPGTKERDVSPPSDTSSLSEEPYVIAADVASSKYSTEHAGSKRDSGFDQLATLTDEDEEPRGRKGFRERFLKKVIPGRDKDKEKQKPGPSESAAGTATGTAPTSAPAPATTITHPAATEPQSEPQSQPAEAEEAGEAHANPDEHVLSETEPLREKVQEPSTTSTEATGNTTVTGTTTPALTHAQTNGDDDEDFDEARDTFDEGRLVSASKVDSGAARLVDVVSPTSAKKSEEKSREGSRFTEEL